MAIPVQPIFNPLERYRDEFREAFAKASEEAFEELLTESGIDSGANAETVAQLRKLEGGCGRVSRMIRMWTFFQMLLSFVFLACLGFGLYFYLAQEPWKTWIWEASGAVLAILVAGFVVWPRLKQLRAQLDRLRDACRKIKEEAWRQMEPLNRLYDWGLLPGLISRVVPNLKFDPFFSEQRLRQLQLRFGVHIDNAAADESLFYAQSGEINGNPFVFGDKLVFSWQDKEYSGSRVVSWVERDCSKKGVRTRSQTLTATVTHPAPAYAHDHFLLYGNETAPDLFFSRVPKGLADAKDGFFSRLAYQRELKKVRAFADILDDESQYTMMSNEAFEVLFQTMNRTSEQQYRVLYTPLAQRQTLALINDKTVGYGDDFCFLKNGKHNFIRSKHLSRTELSTDPKRFYHYDLAAARRQFAEISNEYFKSLYFSFAPLLAIPEYQIIRPGEDLYRNGLDSPRASVWERESLVNYLGGQAFRHPESVTENILKTEFISCKNGVSKLRVYAHGFRAVRHVTQVPKMAWNGRTYDVPVEWFEYLPVLQKSTFYLSEIEALSRAEYAAAVAHPTAETEKLFNALGTTPEKSLLRRGILSAGHPVT